MRYISSCSEMNDLQIIEAILHKGIKMFKATVLESKESKAVVGGMVGPYGECYFVDNRPNGVYGWFRRESGKNGLEKRCDEK